MQWFQNMKLCNYKTYVFDKFTCGQNVSRCIRAIFWILACWSLWKGNYRWCIWEVRREYWWASSMEKTNNFNIVFLVSHLFVIYNFLKFYKTFICMLQKLIPLCIWKYGDLFIFSNHFFCYLFIFGDISFII